MKYNYTRALRTPYLIQQITKNFALPKPIRLIAFGLLCASALFCFIVFQWLFYLTGWSVPVLMLTCGALPYVMMKVLLDVKTDGKPIFRYLYDLFGYYIRFGWRHKKRTIENEPIVLEDDIIMFI